VKLRRLFVRVTPATITPDETTPAAALRDAGGSSLTAGSSGSVEPTVPEEPARDEPASRRAPDTMTVSVAGLDRADGRGGLTDEVAALAAACGLGVTVTDTNEEEPQ